MNLDPQLLVDEVVGWKWLQHENILPFLGILLEPPLFSIISDQMENGTIMDFIKLHPTFNRLHLVSQGYHLSYHSDYLDIACRCISWVRIPP